MRSSCLTAWWARGEAGVGGDGEVGGEEGREGGDARGSDDSMVYRESQWLAALRREEDEEVVVYAEDGAAAAAREEYEREPE